MKNLYYSLWVDAISKIRKNNPEKKNWKIAIYVAYSWINAINFWVIMIWLKHFNILSIPLLEIDIFPGEILDSFFGFAVEFAAPFFLLNYFLIFHKNRYEQLIEKYQVPKAKYALIYLFTVLGTAWLSAMYLVFFTS